MRTTIALIVGWVSGGLVAYFGGSIPLIIAIGFGSTFAVLNLHRI